MGRILRSNSVKLEGRFRLSSPNEKSAASAPSQVRILENHPQFAVIEITCACGAKIHVKCEYAAGQPPDDASEPNHVTEQTK